MQLNTYAVRILILVIIFGMHALLPAEVTAHHVLRTTRASILGPCAVFGGYMIAQSLPKQISYLRNKVKKDERLLKASRFMLLDIALLYTTYRCLKIAYKDMHLTKNFCIHFFNVNGKICEADKTIEEK